MEDFESFWLSIIQQKCVFVCFKSGLDKIIGLQFNYVNTKNDNFYEKLREKVSIKLMILIYNEFKCVYSF